MTIRKRWTDAPVSSLPPTWEDRKTHTPPSIHTAQNTADLLGQNDKCARRRRREDLSGVPVHTRVWALSRGRACGPAARRGFLDFRGNREEVAWRGFLTFCVVLFLNATFLNARNRLYAARIFFRHRSSGRVRITAPPGPGCDCWQLLSKSKCSKRSKCGYDFTTREKREREGGAISRPLGALPLSGQRSRRSR